MHVPAKSPEQSRQAVNQSHGRAQAPAALKFSTAPASCTLKVCAAGCFLGVPGWRSSYLSPENCSPAEGKVTRQVPK